MSECFIHNGGLHKREKRETDQTQEKFSNVRSSPFCSPAPSWEFLCPCRLGGNLCFPHRVFVSLVPSGAFGKAIAAFSLTAQHAITWQHMAGSVTSSTVNRTWANLCPGAVRVSQKRDLTSKGKSDLNVQLSSFGRSFELLYVKHWGS